MSYDAPSILTDMLVSPFTSVKVISLMSERPSADKSKISTVEKSEIVSVKLFVPSVISSKSHE